MLAPENVFRITRARNCSYFTSGKEWRTNLSQSNQSAGTHLSKLTETLNLVGGSMSPHGRVGGGGLRGAVTRPLKWNPAKKLRFIQVNYDNVGNIGVHRFPRPARFNGQITTDFSEQRRFLSRVIVQNNRQQRPLFELSSKCAGNRKKTW